ncbi:MAG: hypothetical protein ACI9HK_003515, partial [Pirellulaceae bacterium]
HSMISWGSFEHRAVISIRTLAFQISASAVGYAIPPSDFLSLLVSLVIYTRSRAHDVAARNGIRG